MGVIIDEAARIHDPIEHSHALAGIIGGVLIGAAIGLAVVGTGGAAIVAIGVVCTYASVGGTIGQFLGSLWVSEAGGIMSGAATVFIGRRKAARAIVDTVECHTGEKIAQGSETVFIESQPAARKGDKTTCDGTISKGFPRVLVGSGRGTYLEISPEVPAWLENTVMALGLVSGVGEIALAAKGLKLFTAARVGGEIAGGEALSYVSDRVADLLFEEGSTGHKIFSFVGGQAAGHYGGKLGGHLGGRAVTSHREGVARSFYAEHGLKYDPEIGGMRPYKASEIDSHLQGIDFRHPVRVIDNPPSQLGQIQAPGGRQGQYYAADGTPPSHLGIGDLGTAPDGSIATKESVLYSIPEGTPALQTTAAPINDTWSVKGLTQPSSGGATQYYIPNGAGTAPLTAARPLAPEALTTMPTFPTPPSPP